MNAQAAIEAALKAASITASVKSQSDLSGGCIHRVVRLALTDGTTLVAKFNRSESLAMFQEETHGLAALAATQTVITPRPLAVIAHEGAAVLLMTALRTTNATNIAWQKFGLDLAALHAAPAGERYGWNEDNHLGSTLQPNGWHDDWIEFNARNRLGFQLAMACENGLFDHAETAHIERVINRLDQLIPAKPLPSLLHGDLWSGNALPVQSERAGAPVQTCAIIDPACSIGHALADIAMMRLFGGFPEEAFRSYAEASGEVLDDRRATEAIAVYQLYHVLNHVNLFGRGYAGQALSIAKRLGG